MLHLTLRMQFMLSSASSKSPRYISPFRVSMVTIVPCSPKAHQATVSASSEYVTHKSSSPHASSSNRITHLRIVQQDYWDAHPSLASHRHILCSSTSSDRHDTENEEMLGLGSPRQAPLPLAPPPAFRYAGLDPLQNRQGAMAPSLLKSSPSMQSLRPCRLTLYDRRQVLRRPSKC